MDLSTLLFIVILICRSKGQPKCAGVWIKLMETVTEFISETELVVLDHLLTIIDLFLTIRYFSNLLSNLEGILNSSTMCVTSLLMTIRC